MKNLVYTSLVTIIITLFSVAIYAEDSEITKIADYKKVLVQFMKPVDMQLSQFARDTGRSSTENKSPNYRLLFESAKMQGPEESGAQASCKIYQKTMLSNRVKNYAEEALKFEKTINEKVPVTLSSDVQWTITKATANEKGFMLWLSGEKKSLQIDCEKKTVQGEEQQMNPKEVFTALATNEVRFFKDGKEMKLAVVKNPETSVQPISSDITNGN